MEEEKQPIEPVVQTSHISLSAPESDTETVLLDKSDSPEIDANPEQSYSPKKQKTTAEYQDISFDQKNAAYRSFSTTNQAPSASKQSNPIEQILHQATTLDSGLDSDEDEEKKKIAAAKKLLFPNAVATSFPEVADTLRDERRQEFCPIYNDETPEAIALRQTGRKPIGSLLAKRIRWDDLKRKRDENHRQAQVPVRYGPYGPIYSNQQPSFPNTYGQYRGNTQHQPQPQPSFANPYEQYYTAVQHQYEQMAQLNRVQQEYNGFWPGSSPQPSLQNNHQIAQNSIEQQTQPYTYPYPPMYFNNMTSSYPNIPSSYTSTDYQTYLRQPPPPPPTEPYPY